MATNQAVPVVTAYTDASGTGHIAVDGVQEPFDAPTVDVARGYIVDKLSAMARNRNEVIRAATTDPDGVWTLIVDPQGRVQAEVQHRSEGIDEDTAQSPSRPRREPKPITAPQSIVATEPPAPIAAVQLPAPAAPVAPAAPSYEAPSAFISTPPAATAVPQVTPAPAPSYAPPAAAPTTSAPAPTYAQPSAAPAASALAPTFGLHQATAASAQPQLSQPGDPQNRRDARRSFLTQEQTEEPATNGWRGALSRVGIRLSPSEDERAERADVQAVSQHWPGPRTIAVVNAKGGSSKTPTTILLAAVFARFGGAGVLTWDNNQTRGTLGWRTEQGPHESTLLELLPQVDRLLSTGAQSADLAHYVHHQTRDRFDVLRSQPTNLAHEQRMAPADVDAIHAVASKYYRLVFIDSGNDESDPMWLRMIDHTDQLVLATTTRDDHAEAGALLLEALAKRNEKSAHLANQAVVVVNQANAKGSKADVDHVANGYRGLVRDVATIPFDQAMVDGVLRYGSLGAKTQRAWLAAGAAVARGL
ncbi:MULTISPECIES: AAA family ATPase [unclassified Pseudoclavibacter]|uniref:AAA family ATPase n=1 Tax=unclassified Pseudoclavibacter TaxID=2615177 RepID=UPI0021579A7C|nr:MULTISPECIES: AAA family ATPase [unclassified Pseudoclavibacter]